MALIPDLELEHTMREKYQGDGFVIEDGIIKGDEKVYPIIFETIGELLFDTLNKFPEYIVQIDGISGTKKTYKHLKECSVRLAIWMKKVEIDAGDMISLCSASHVDIDTIIFATIFIGATYATFPQDLNLHSARRYINHIKPKVIFACKSKINMLQEAAALENHCWKIIVLGEDPNYASFEDILRVQTPDEIANFQLSKINPTNMCMIMPTSGTTGIPKFVCYSYENITRVIETFDVNRANMKNPNKLAYVYPDWEVHFLLLLKYFLDGSTQIFHKDFDPRETCMIIEKQKVNELLLTTHHASLLCENDVARNYNLQSVNLVIPVGSILFAAVEVKLKDIFPNGTIRKSLGISETYSLTRYTNTCRNPESQGTIVPNVQLKIVDVETGRILGQNQPGEILVKTPSIMTGYYKDPVATQLAFDDEGWFRTGDEAYYDENGEIVVIGRLKECIKFRDADIHPSYIESILLSHPDIVDAAVVGIHHEVDIEHPVAFIKINFGSNVREEDVLKLTSELEYSNTFKDSVIFIDEIPRSTNGKIKRRALRERAEKFYANRQMNF